MRNLLLGLLLLNGGGAAALAADADPLEHYYGNTWEIRRPEETIWIYANADGTWDGIFQGEFYAGKNWRVEGEIICFFNPTTDAHAAPDASCFRGLEGRKVGETWKSVVEGREKEWSSTLYKGRTVPPAGSAARSAGDKQSG